MKLTSRGASAPFGVAAVLLFGLASVLLLANRPAEPSAPRPIPISGGANPSTAAVVPTPPLDAEANDLFAGYCVRESHVMLRAFTTAELQAYDSAAKARGSAGWLRDGDRFSAGQGWVGDLDGATEAYGGTKFDRPERPGNWIITERDGKPMGMSMRSVELPSGSVLWLPEDFITVSDCVP